MNSTREWSQPERMFTCCLHRLSREPNRWAVYPPFERRKMIAVSWSDPRISYETTKKSFDNWKNSLVLSHTRFEGGAEGMPKSSLSCSASTSSFSNVSSSFLLWICTISSSFPFWLDSLNIRNKLHEPEIVQWKYGKVSLNLYRFGVRLASAMPSELHCEYSSFSSETVERTKSAQNVSSRSTEIIAGLREKNS